MTNFPLLLPSFASAMDSPPCNGKFVRILRRAKMKRALNQGDCQMLEDGSIPGLFPSSTLNRDLELGTFYGPLSKYIHFISSARRSIFLYIIYSVHNLDQLRLTIWLPNFWPIRVNELDTNTSDCISAASH